MDKKTMERIEHKLCAELDEIAEKEELSIGDLDVIDKSTHAMKSMYAIKREQGGEYSMAGMPAPVAGPYSMANGGGYSQNGNWVARGMYGPRSYGVGPYEVPDAISYAGPMRNTMGQYSMTEAPETLKEELKRMMDAGALTAQQKEAAHKFMDSLTK